jgi:flavin reductase (DIM6/NTAB) family NADH-FMN oxidoreductase RutF
MTEEEIPMDALLELDPTLSVWDRVYTASSLVVIGTREGDGYDLAPKHMAGPLGWEGWYAFVCTPAHATYHNARESGAFTVSYPRPDQVVITSLTAAPRCGEGESTPGLDALPRVPAQRVEGPVLRDAALVLECELDRIIDGFGGASLVVGRILTARAHPQALRTTGVEDEEVVRRFPILAYLSPGRFAALDHSQAFPFPAGFKE